MTAREFPLAGLLRARALQEERAASQLADANHARDTAVREVQRAQSSLAALTMRAGATHRASEFGAAVTARASAAARTQDLAAVADTAGVTAAEATQVWRTARRSAAAIERLGERHALAMQVEEQRSEQRVLDEAALRSAREDA